MKFEEYFRKILKKDKSYHWPINFFKTHRSERQILHNKFPFVVTMCGYSGAGDDLEVMETWCYNHIGLKDGICTWYECEHSFDRWYDESNFNDILEEDLSSLSLKYNKNTSEYCIKSSKLIKHHFDMIQQKYQKPEIHNHTGDWNIHFIMKTGYDYGYQDFCFKHEHDAIHFKLIWKDNSNE